MPVISFKANSDFKETLLKLSARTGINLSAYIKMLLTKSVKEELSRTTENGMTVAEELAILSADSEDTIGPFSSVEELRKSLSS
jgi:hypothetical protein